jgi:hypothetical protein
VRGVARGSRERIERGDIDAGLSLDDKFLDLVARQCGEHPLSISDDARQQVAPVLVFKVLEDPAFAAKILDDGLNVDLGGDLDCGVRRGVDCGRLV